MKRFIVISLLTVHATVLQAAEKGASEALPQQTQMPTEAEIQKAIKETLAEKPTEPSTKPERPIYGTNDRVTQRMTRAFNEAKVPDCLHPDAMKFTPPQLGPVVLTEEFALPFWAYAALNGKCH